MSKREDARRATDRRTALGNSDFIVSHLDSLLRDTEQAIAQVAAIDPSSWDPSDETVRHRAVTGIDQALGDLPALGRRLRELRQTLDPDGSITPTVNGLCDWCKNEFPRTRVDAAYCSAKCRQAAYRHRLGASRLSNNP